MGSGSRLFLVVACCLPVVLAGCARLSRQAAPLTYVAIGASDAVGVGTPHPETDGWVPQFGAALGPETRVINLGVSGSTASQAMAEQLPPALDARPDVVTVWLAVNDLNARVPLPEYAASLDELLAALAGSGARVLVGNVPDLTPVAAYSGIDPLLLAQEIDRWNAAIAGIAARHGAQVVDLHAHWQEVAAHPEYVGADGFHPSREGYARLAQLFVDAYQNTDLDTAVDSHAPAASHGG